MAGGRPPLFNSDTELQEAVDKYFSLLGDKPATITGLALALGFESRQSLYDYEDREEFSYTVKRARLKIECEYEQKLSGNSVTGPIFALKNLGWKDKSEVEQKVTGGLNVSYVNQKGNEALPDDDN